MSLQPAAGDSAEPSFANHLAHWCGRWVPFDSVWITPDDLGFRQGVTAVERLRTYGGQPFELDAHLDRWQGTVQALGIRGLPERQTLRQLNAELLARNADWVRAQSDVGITWLATPGSMANPGSTESERPTWGLHLNRLDFARIEHDRSNGQPLVITDVVQPDPATWPRAIKVRCRLHYYLADRQARQRDEPAVGVLLDQDGTVTETGIANLAIVEGNEIISPPAQRVLGGVTQRVVERLAERCSIPWRHEPVSIERARAAASVLLMGTDAGLWYASRIDGRPLSAGPLYHRLLQQWDRQVTGRTQRNP